MVDLSKLSDAARAAAMKGGTEGWGRMAFSLEHIRYAEKISRRARKCHCGCEGRETHTGCANGLALMSGCELSVRRWVKNPLQLQRPPSKRPDLPEVRGRATFTVRMNVARTGLSALIDRVLADDVIVIRRKDERVAIIPAEWLDDLRAVTEAGKEAQPVEEER